MEAVFTTKSQHGYAVEFSPYFAHRLACAASQYFGIAGSGAVFFLDITPDGHIVPRRRFTWKQGLYDVTWSEFDETVAVTCSADGSVQVWDVDAESQIPVKCMKEHTKEVAGVDWSQDRRASLVLSASWDATIKLARLPWEEMVKLNKGSIFIITETHFAIQSQWDVSRDSSLATFRDHKTIVYSAIWSPHIPGCFASTSGDGTVRFWDIRTPHSATLVTRPHTSEILTCDWSKYDKNIVFSGSSDCCVRCIDLRSPSRPLFELRGHEYPIRRLKCSPFDGHVLATCSYDFYVRLWNIALESKAVETIRHHTEFVCGLDFNLHVPGQMVDCAWDETVKVYTRRSFEKS